MTRWLRRSVPLFTIALVALLASSAHAQLNLSWDDCGSFGTVNHNFACTTNTSPLAGINAHYLVGSFVSPGVTELTGEDAYVEVVDSGPTTNQWWSITNFAGTVVGCRPNAVLATTFGDAQGLGSCSDYWGTNGALGGTDYIVNVNGQPNHTRIRLLGAVASNVAGPVPAGQENYAFTCRIKNDLTTGAGACAGCSTQMCLSFVYLLLTQPVGVGDLDLSGPPGGGREWVSWQGGSCIPVPATRSSWGQIKALYR